MDMARQSATKVCSVFNDLRAVYAKKFSVVRKTYCGTIAFFTDQNGELTIIVRSGLPSFATISNIYSSVSPARCWGDSPNYTIINY